MYIRVAFALCLMTVPATAGTTSLKPKKWELGPRIDGTLYSYDENRQPIEKKKLGKAWAFNIPKSPGEVDYVTTGCKDLANAKFLVLIYDVVGEGKLKATEGPDPARIRLHIQRKGDDWSGSGSMQHYRFWSVPYADLTYGKDQTLEATIDYSQWTGVYGQTNADGFQSAVKNCSRMGVTFGGQLAGHGVRVRKGSARFIMRRFEVSE